MAKMVEVIYACRLMSSFARFTFHFFFFFTNGLVHTYCRCILLESIFPLNAVPKLREMGHNHIKIKYLFVKFTRNGMSLFLSHRT